MLARDVTSDLTINSNTAPDDYVIFSGATLTGNGARLNSVQARGGGALVLQGGTVTNSSHAIDLRGASADLDGVHVSSSGGRGLAMLEDPSTGTMATATVRGGSTVEGTVGVYLGVGSTLTLIDSTVTGNSVSGLESYNATLDARGSAITGALYGIRVNDGFVGTELSILSLSDTDVTGLGGAAIAVGTAARKGTAQILISNGSTLQGEGGRLIDVAQDSQADVTVLGSALEGSLLAGDNATLNLTLGQGASLTGNILGQATGTAALSMTDGALFTGRLENVANVSLANGAAWQLVENTTQENLALSGGVVRLGDDNAFRSLTVGNLSGNGEFDLRTNFATGQTDFIDVTGSSAGSHVLNVASSGQDAAQARIQVVHTADGNASFSLKNGLVDLGAWSYQLVGENGNSDWYLDGTQKIISPGAASALALFNTAPSVWYGEMTTLRSRMGEIRRDASQAGGWLRAYGNKMNVATAEGIGYRQQQQGLSFGADTPVALGDGQWRLGLMGGYSQSALDLQRGTTGEVKSLYAGAYATWLDAPSGYYIDAVAKVNQFRNEAKVALSDGSRTQGDYDNYGVGASLEVGRHIALAEGWFVEPYAQASSLVVQGRQFNLDNGLQASGDSARSLLGKAGATLGRRIELGEGRSVQPYVRAALAHEFAKRNEVAVNGNRFNNDLAGSRGELGAGVAVNLAERLQLHADFDYAKGERIEQPWGVNAGVRYLW
ncbi:autotransporter outer membrane beta-barrel domain-containing protein [Pseudomonas sp. NPDC007930]|uniref:autotransporter outer membrane beta-barrel domain-containing protein n=1 Tax=Pseudomonas sp. NPDC007930 TaxID=3364417 RepID=UPI0036E9BE05